MESSADKRLLLARKEIWSAQLHNAKAQILAVRDRMRELPEEQRRAVASYASTISEACKLINECIYALDIETAGKVRHTAINDKDQWPA